MCGIVGYVGWRQASEVVIEGLKRLEYRGYDSAGIATLNGNGIELKRCVGKLGNLELILRERPISGHVGVGHTRWATHGRPSEENAHPHCAGNVAVVHNGIIENYLDLRAELLSRGRELRSETDTEVIAHLVDENIQLGMPLADATRAAARRLAGSFAIVVISGSEENRLVAVKTATPIVIGVGTEEKFVASDIPALLDYTREFIVLDDGDVAELTRDCVTMTDLEGRPRQREPRHIAWDAVTAKKGGHKHFLIKEIHEQPQSLSDTLRGRVHLASGEVELPELEPIASRLAEAERVSLVGCGTAWHAALLGKFFLNELAGLPADVDYGSEYRYRSLALDERDLVVVVSQSGETADTLGSLEEGRRRGALSLAVCNVVDSSIARRADGVIYMNAGPEISVCSTKAFTAQLLSLLLLSVYLGRRRNWLTTDTAREFLSELRFAPQLVRDAVATEDSVKRIARKYAGSRDFLFLGRGVNYPIALEGALKLKEISYIHAEGYPAGEMKHGPIALITEEMPVVVLIPHDPLYAKTLSNMKEVQSRGGRIIAVADACPPELGEIASDVLVVPPSHPLLSPLPFSIPLQLLAYHVAVARGTDVDQPRNLAKSVTVE
jgi:glucosamine--fructose-6-phosphate aminotransferase (isomerizing)